MSSRVDETCNAFGQQSIMFFLIDGMSEKAGSAPARNVMSEQYLIGSFEGCSEDTLNALVAPSICDGTGEVLQAGDMTVLRRLLLT